MSGKRGRPRLPKKEGIFLRVERPLHDDLQFLSDLLDGNPSVPKLAAFAIREYVKKKLAEPAIREAYDAMRAPPAGLRVVRDHNG